MTEQVLALTKLESRVSTGNHQLAMAKLESRVKSATQHKVSLVHAEVRISIATYVPPVPLPNTFKPDVVPCIPPPRSRFHKFWSTQPNACPPELGQATCDPTVNSSECLKPGLVLNYTYDQAWQALQCAPDGGGGLPDCPAPITGASIATNDYVRGLALNILGTNAAQAASICGNQPGQRLGYWLDDVTGVKSGSSIRYVPLKGFSINQQVAFIKMQGEVDMKKLITYGVAVSVVVSAKYAGLNTVALDIVINGVDDQKTTVNTTVTKIANAWVWNS